MSAGEPPPPCTAAPRSQNAHGDCDVGVCERGFVLGSHKRDVAGLHFLGCASFCSPIAAGSNAEQQAGAKMVGLTAERKKVSWWKEAVILKLQLVFSVVQRASAILATSPDH